MELEKVFRWFVAMMILSDTENYSKHDTLTKSVLTLNDFLKCMTRQHGENGQCG